MRADSTTIAGWAADDAIHAPPSAPPVSDVTWLIDNAETYRALLAAISTARKSVWISQLAFDADCRHYRSADDTTGVLLLDSLCSAAARGVDVCILLNTSLLLDTAKSLRAALEKAGAERVRVRGISRFPSLLHAKMVIVDGVTAFLVGSPFVNGYWDDGSHPPVDDRRPDRELGGRPLHDVSMRVNGEGARKVAHVFAEFWNDAAVQSTISDRIAAPALQARTSREVQLTRSTPARALKNRVDGDVEILPSLVRAINAAKSLIYIEHQYLSSRRIVDALETALLREPGLEIIAVLNQNPDVTAYRVWQNTRLRDAGLLEHPRVGIFALWAMEWNDNTLKYDVNQLFVHSKVVIVDDCWTSVGSANLDGVSLHSYGHDFASKIGQRVFRNVRNFDVNLELHCHNAERSNAVYALRRRLWAEHLQGCQEALPGSAEVHIQEDHDTPARACRWRLAEWSAAARRNIAALNGVASRSICGRLLPYSTRATPQSQLEDIGVSMDRIQLHFDPGWMEVHCSPTWVRNMFA